MSAEEKQVTQALMGSWIQWGVGALFFFLSWYVGTTIAPVAKDLEDLTAEKAAMKAEIKSLSLTINRQAVLIEEIKNEHHKIETSMSDMATKEAESAAHGYISTDIDRLRTRFEKHDHTYPN